MVVFIKDVNIDNKRKIIGRRKVSFVNDLKGQEFISLLII
jgi:hypothetical protein